jgi:acyl-CoA reductase-like NAD-dependent aldehyde dehydrogenase
VDVTSEVVPPATGVAAREAQPLWALLPPAARARYLRRAAVAMLDELDELADRLAEGTGWPRSHLVVLELLPAVRGLQALAGEGPSALADRRLNALTARLARRRSMVVQAPMGIVGLTGPSASPWQEPALEAAAALLAGNGVLLAAGAAARRLRAVFLRAGVPGELIVPVTGAADGLRGACDRVTRLAPPTRMGTLLVLGGAPRAAVVDAAVWAAFAASGRHPAAAGRLIVSRTAAPGLAQAIAAAAAKLRVGDPRDPATDVGPLASAEDLAAVGRPRVTVPGASGTFVAPFVTTSREAFDAPPPGPVLAIVEAAGDDEAIALAATSGSDGVVSIWTADQERGERVARSLPSRTVWVGRHGVPVPAVSARLERYVAPKRLEIRAGRAPAAMRLPATPDVVDARAALAEARHGRESRRWGALRRGAAALLRAARRQR